MILTILNRNKEEDYEYSEKEYEVDEGCNITDCYNETLDSGVVTVSNVSEKIKMEPFDILVIDEDKYFCVDTYTEMMLCVNPVLYKYEIHFFSLTKLLENTVLPNLKITKNYDVSPRSVFYYINQYMSEYCPQVRIRQRGGTTYNEYKWIPKIHWNTQELIDKFSMECPEMQWNTPTLREVLNDLMMVADCIPTVKINYYLLSGDIMKGQILSFLDLTATPETNPEHLADVTTDTHINYVSRSKSSEDYVSELQVKLENVTNNVENVNNIVTRAEYVPFDLPQDEATLTTDNILLKTKYPIYKLKSLKIMFPGALLDDQSNWNQAWCETDLMTYDLVAEYQNWIIKKIKYNSSAPSSLFEFRDYQNWTLYYTRGTNEIRNWQDTTKKYIWFTQVLWQVICQKIIATQIEPPVGNAQLPAPPQWYNVFFKVEYETLEGCLFRASKNDIQDNEGLVNERTIIDNQTNSYVDSYSQGFLEYQKANRLGNEQIQINARYESDYTGHMIRIGDVYDDSVVYQVQYQYFKNHIEVNAIATKNYILREYFTGVKSKIRSWKVVSGNEALTRHDVIKYYCEFSYEKYIESHGLERLATNDIALYLSSPVLSYESAPLKYAYVRTEGSSDYYPALYDDSYTFYLVDLMTRVVGNSLVLTFAFDDNCLAGKGYATTLNSSGDGTIQESDIDGGAGGVSIKTSALLDGKGVATYNYKYTDDDGENYYTQVIFASGVKVGSNPAYDDAKVGDNWFDDDSPNDVTMTSNCFIWGIYQRPRVFPHNLKWDYGEGYEELDYNYEVFRTECELHKDSQEITNLSTQLEFCTETRDISVGKQWLTRQQAVNTELYNDVSNLKLLFYNKKQYNFRRPNELPSGGYLSEEYVRVFAYSTDNVTCGLYITLLKTGQFNNSQSDARNMAIELKSGSCVYLNDGDALSNNILLSLNNIPDNNCFGVQVEDKWYPSYLVHLNILKSRNKCLYLINDSCEVYCKMNEPV